MNNTQKMRLVPVQDGDGNDDLFPPQPSVASNIMRKGNSIRKYAADRQQKLLTIILKLALHGAYDEDGKFQTSDGSVDIGPLLMQACSPGRNVRGMSEFIDMLHEAGVTPDLVLNINIRDELSKRYGNRRNVTRKLPLRYEDEPPSRYEEEPPSRHEEESRYEDEPPSRNEEEPRSQSRPVRRSLRKARTGEPKPMYEEVIQQKRKRDNDESELPPAKTHIPDWDANDSDSNE